MGMQVRVAAAIFTGLLTMGAGPPPPGLAGRWAIEGNHFQSSIYLDFGPTSVRAKVGCLAEGHDYRVADGTITYSAEAVQIEAPCVSSEMKPEAWTYWSTLLRKLPSLDRYRIAGDRLTLSSATGEILSFRRIGRAH
jgi:hypothetical protein